ncbi:oligosaccharide flippase family protein [Pseudocolwellia sp. HL-MZ7]|uniref:oligosaccharide flippase family protein n=1 Tax=Pseudocolwellia sp. HL-MZ7 TaxID=3400627 RepID=UPI003CEEFFD6
MSTKKLFFKSSIFRFIERIVLVVSSLLLTPYFINVLGANGYGFWLLILSIIGWFNVIELGFPSAVQRHTILALEKDDPVEVNTVFSTSIVLFGCLGLAAVALLACVALFSADFFGSSVDADALKMALFVLSAKIIMDFLMNPFHGFITAFLRLDIDSNLVMVNVLIKSILIFLLIPTMNIWGAIIATLFADVLTNGVKIYYIKKLYPAMKFSFKLVSKEELKSLFAFSKHVVANGVANTLNSKADPFIVTKLIGLSSVAVYGVANRLAEHIKSFVFTVNGFLSPVFMRKNV